MVQRTFGTRRQTHALAQWGIVRHERGEFEEKGHCHARLLRPLTGEKRACRCRGQAPFPVWRWWLAVPLPAIQLLIIEVDDDVLVELQSWHLLRRVLDDIYNGLPFIIR